MKVFKKKHLIIRNNLFNFIKNGFNGFFLIYFKKNGCLKEKEYNALIFFIKKRFKVFSKIFLRLNYTLIRTEKPIGVRMGKGKGNLSDFYLPVSKGQIFLEFFFSFNSFLLKDNDFLNNIKIIFLKFSKKINVSIGLMKNFF